MEVLLTHYIDNNKRETPLVLGSIDNYNTLGPIHDITLVSLDYCITVQTMNEILKGIRKVTPEQYCGIYARLEFEQSHSVSYPFLLMSDIVLNPPSVWMLRLTLDRQKVLLEHREKVCEIPITFTDPDKSEPSTYTDPFKAKAYLNDKYRERVSDVYQIIRSFSRLYGIHKIIAPNDGAGVAYSACASLGIDCVSSDPSPAMVAEAASLGNHVLLGNGGDLIQSECGVVFISHSEGLDPGLVAMSLKLNKHVIVYESVEVYAGYSLLYDNGSYVRSTFDVTLPLKLARVPYAWKLTDWNDIVKNGVCFYISDEMVVPHLAHLKLKNIKVSVSTSSYKVIEMLAVHQISHIPYASGHVGVYLNKIDRKCSSYFSLRMGIHHGSPDSFAHYKDSEDRSVYYVYALNSDYQVNIGGHSYGVLRSLVEGIDEYGHRRVISSLYPRLTSCRKTHLIHSPLELLHERASHGYGVLRSSLTHGESEVLTKQLFDVDVRVLSKVYWKPIDIANIPPCIRGSQLVSRTWQSKYNLFKIDGHQWDFDSSGYFWDGKRVTEDYISQYYCVPKIETVFHRKLDNLKIMNVSPIHGSYNLLKFSAFVGEGILTISALGVEIITLYPEYFLSLYANIWGRTVFGGDVKTSMGVTVPSLRNSGGIVRNLRDDSGGTTTFTTELEAHIGD